MGWLRACLGQTYGWLAADGWLHLRLLIAWLSGWLALRLAGCCDASRLLAVRILTHLASNQQQLLYQLASNRVMFQHQGNS